MPLHRAGCKKGANILICSAAANAVNQTVKAMIMKMDPASTYELCPDV